MQRFRVQIEFTMVIPDEPAEREVQDLAHRLIVEMTEQNRAEGGRIVGEFVQTPRQGADYLPQDLRSAVSLTTGRVVALGRAAALPGVELADVKVRSEPL